MSEKEKVIKFADAEETVKKLGNSNDSKAKIVKADTERVKAEMDNKKDIITALLYDGYYSETVKIGDQTFTLRTLSTAELTYADERVQEKVNLGTGQRAASRYMTLYYLAMSILNPFERTNANSADGIISYLNSEDFGKALEETVKALSLKPDVIIEYLYAKYSDITLKATRVLESPKGMDNGDYLKK